MGFEDRAYSRGGGQGPWWGPLGWILFGSLPLFTFAGIRVRAHASMVILVAAVALFGLGFEGFTRADAVLSMTVLFLVVLLHEFGHCFAARAVGGTADDILMTPLGGLAFASPPRRPLPTFITVICGPLVNLVLMLVAAVVIFSVGGRPAINPFGFLAPPDVRGDWTSVWWYASWFYSMNYWLLLFNLIPSYPLDGGQITQTILWRPLGYYKSMLVAATVGMFGAGGMILFGIAGGGLLLAFVGISCLMTCVQMRQQLKAAGPWAFGDEDGDYSAASWSPSAMDRSDARAERDEKRAMESARREAERESAEQAKIDRILEKVGREGMHSLSWLEKRALKQATERQRQRTLRGRR